MDVAGVGRGRFSRREPGPFIGAQRPWGFRQPKALCPVVPGAAPPGEVQAFLSLTTGSLSQALEMLALHLNLRVVGASVSGRGQRAGVGALETRLRILLLTCVSIVLSCRFIPTGAHLTFLLRRRQRSWNCPVCMDYLDVLRAAPALGEGSPSPCSSRGSERSPRTAPTPPGPRAPPSVLTARARSPPAALGAPWAQGLTRVRCSWIVTGIESINENLLY